MSVYFQLFPQNANQITIDLPPSSSNHSCLTRRNIVIGTVGIGLTAAAAAAAYFLIANNAFTEADFIKPPINENLQSLHDIVKNITTSSNGYYNCVPAFQAHWERFKECGVSAHACMQNSIKLFGELFCKPPTKGYIDDHSEECENNYFTLARCNP
ncbi:MAG: hypothetical protein C5B45_05855 [Chlamydiae bacterium]|nr:MAG: hypothetical protein C5B45_05855 [Chlamydiota bacterium]